MLTFYPEFESSSDDSGQSANFEVTFILDASNSMTGTVLQDAKKVVLLALRHLPSMCLFNVVVFGTCNYLCLLVCSRFWFFIFDQFWFDFMKKSQSPF